MSVERKSSRVHAAVAALFLTLTTSALAHDPGLSTATIVVRPERCDATLVFSLTTARIIVDAHPTFEGKLDANGVAKELQKIADGALELNFSESKVSATEARCSLAEDSIKVQLAFPRQPSATLSVKSKWLTLLPPGHRQIVTIETPNETILAQSLLSANADSLSVELGKEVNEEKLKPVKNSFESFLALGVKHIWTGYDHLLFLFGLLAVTRSIKSVIQIITCFTIAHSITLAIATLNVIEISGRIVEPLIAASIVFVGAENFLRHGEPKGRMILTSAFGLVHGFGFASALRELGVGSNGSGVALPLFSFNLGVELGQIAVAAIALPLIWKLKSQPVLVRRWVPATSVVITLLGSYWFVERVWQ
jgi:hydrogenase/urease accessory protein HupE